MTSSHGGEEGAQPIRLGPFPFALPIIRLMALDPGGTTGWAKVTSLPDINELEFTHGQLGPHEHHTELYDHLEIHSPYTVICESFEFRQMGSDTKKKVELISREYIGVTKLYCSYFNVHLEFQTASTAKALIPDKGPAQDVKLKQLGLYVPGAKHARDAYRHLLRYMVVSDRSFKNFFAERWMAND